ncbi:uncharacterized protein METZ01_LOCUS409565, partial [marine metagenome]
LILLLTVSNAQNRSLIFTTGSPNDTAGYTIQWDGATGQSVSDRIYISGNMVLEALKIYAVANTEPAMAKIVLQADNDGVPGEEIYSWNLDVAEETHGNNYFLIITTDLCIYLDADNYYWLTLHAIDTESQITWFYSNNATFTYTTSNDQGENWETASIGNCGSLSVWAESIYETEFEETTGDINEDGSVNVLDVVILANVVLTGEYLSAGDINVDGVNNVLDIVELINIILNGPSYEQLPIWDYVDINTNSDYFDQLIGPDTFNGNVSLYYFGKAG